METNHEASEYSPHQPQPDAPPPAAATAALPQQQPDAPPPAAAVAIGLSGMDHYSSSRNNNGYIGRHRMAASISILENQIKLLQEELDELESIGESSTVCKKLAFTVESRPDPLLPLTKGPADIDWDRWFQPVHNTRRRWL